VFREIAEQILPDLGIAPDTQLKPDQQVAGELVAQTNQATTQTKSDAAKSGATQQGAEGATQPRNTTSVVTQAGRDGEIVYAVATKNAVLMPDLRGSSVRDVARTCAQLGLKFEARGEGRVKRQSPAPGAEVANSQVVHVEFDRVE
jgi:hypothetical protein